MTELRQVVSSTVRHMLRFTWHHGGDPTSNAPSCRKNLSFHAGTPGVPAISTDPSSPVRCFVQGRKDHHMGTFPHAEINLKPIRVGSLHNTTHFGGRSIRADATWLQMVCYSTVGWGTVWHDAGPKSPWVKRCNPIQCASITG